MLLKTVTGSLHIFISSILASTFLFGNVQFFLYYMLQNKEMPMFCGKRWKVVQIFKFLCPFQAILALEAATSICGVWHPAFHARPSDYKMIVQGWRKLQGRAVPWSASSSYLFSPPLNNPHLLSDWGPEVLVKRQNYRKKGVGVE